MVQRLGWRGFIPQAWVQTPLSVTTPPFPPFRKVEPKASNRKGGTLSNSTFLIRGTKVYLVLPFQNVEPNKNEIKHLHSSIAKNYNER